MGLINFIPSLKFFPLASRSIPLYSSVLYNQITLQVVDRSSQLVHCHISKIPKMEELLNRIVTVQKTILICIHLYHLRSLTFELVRKSSSEKDSFLVFVVCVILLIRIINCLEKERENITIPGMCVPLLLRFSGPRKLILNKSWRANKNIVERTKSGENQT